jgi:hypothetical protein
MLETREWILGKFGKPKIDIKGNTDRSAFASVQGVIVEFTVEPKTIRPGVRIAFLRGPQNVHIELLDRNAA